MTEINLKKRIFGLDFMRAVAICMVLFSHCIHFFPNQNGVIYQLFVLFGFLGVEIFFVLSGFLIGGILLRLYENGLTKEITFNFLKRRWLRTLPNYYIVLLINSILYLFIGGLPDNLWKYFVFLQNFATRIPRFFLESWSLTIEEFAYIILAIVFLVCAKFLLNVKKMFLILIIVIAIITALRFFNYLQNPNAILLDWNLNIRAVLIYRLDAIFIGVVFAYLHKYFNHFWNKFYVLFAVLGFFMMSGMFVGVGYFRITIADYPQFWNVWYFTITSISIAMFLPMLNKISSAPSFLSKPITFISQKSYAFYLVNYTLVLVPFTRYGAKIGLPVHGILAAAIFLTLTLIAGLLLFDTVEKPFMDYRNKTVPDAHRLS